MRLFRGSRDNGSSSTETPSPPPAPSLSPLPMVSCHARPIRFVYCDDKGKFRIDPEALATLQLVKEPIGVVSVCGRARQGKSFILNQVSFSSSCPFFGFFVLFSFLCFFVERFRLGCECSEFGHGGESNSDM